MGKTCEGLSEEMFAEFVEEVSTDGHRKRGNFALAMVMFSLGGRVNEFRPMVWGDLWDFKAKRPKEIVTRMKLKTGCGKAKVKRGSGGAHGRGSVKAKPQKISGRLTPLALMAVEDWYYISEDILAKKRRYVTASTYVFTRGGRKEPSSYKYIYRVFKAIFSDLGFETGNCLTTFATHTPRKTFVQFYFRRHYLEYVRRHGVEADNMAGVMEAIQYAKEQTKKQTGHADMSSLEAYMKHPAENPWQVRPAAFDEMFERVNGELSEEVERRREKHSKKRDKRNKVDTYRKRAYLSREND